MNGRLLIWIAILTIGIGWALGVRAEEKEMDPLLALLVEQGVITMEQARAVEAEYARREAAARTVPEQPPVPPLAVTTEAEEGESVKDEREHWYDRLEIKGDLRLRYEGFNQESNFDEGRRDRERVRLRAGVYSDITDRISMGFQLRSGDPDDPVSDNQSIDGGFTMKQIAISEAFAAFDATSWLDITFGKYDPKKKWVVTDMQWDDDVTVEGAMEELSFGALEASLYQYMLEESAGDSESYLLGGQLRGKFPTGSDSAITVGAGYDEWVGPQVLVDRTLSGELRGNKVTNLLDDDDFLISDFQIFNGFVNWTYSRSPRWPIKFYLFGYYNSGAQGVGQDYDTGYFARLQVGDYKQKGQLMVRYSRYYSEPDAIFYVFSQSDTLRASDVDGHRFDLRIGYVAKSYFSITWYHTKPVFDEVSTMDRWQFDYVLPF